MPNLRDLQHRAEYILIRIVFALFRSFPLDFAVGLSAWALRIAGPWTRQHRRTLANLAIAFPDKSEDERRRIAIAMWEHMGRVMAETMRIEEIVRDPHRFQIVGGEAVAAQMRSPGPVVGVTLHLGNWELAIWPLNACGGNPAAVYRPLPNPYVDRLLREQRTVLYPGGLFGKGRPTPRAEGGQRTARIITDYVRGGGWLGFVCDQVDRRGLAVPFFGHWAKVTPVPAMIARHTGARVWIARCLRAGAESRFRIEIKELEVQRTADKGEDVRTTMAAIFAQFETWIRENPEQWMWWNTRWVDIERTA